MNRKQIRNKIERFEEKRDVHLANGLTISAEMENNVVTSLTKKLEEKIGGSAKD